MSKQVAMTIESGHGDLIAAKVDALVNPVNTMGTMGKGLALQFKQAFPEVFAAYAIACKRGDVVTGRVHVVQRSTSPRYVVNFPTKKHWRHPSRLEYIVSGLEDLVARVRDLGIVSIAIPPLGCGLGGLDWREVRPRIVEAFGSLPDVRVVVYEPSTGR